MAQGTTNSVISELRNAAQQHRTSEEQLQRQRQGLADTVAMLQSMNRGSLMDALKRVHEHWDTDVQEMLKNFRDMAEALDNAATTMQERDASAGEAVG